MPITPCAPVAAAPSSSRALHKQFDDRFWNIIDNFHHISAFNCMRKIAAAMHGAPHNGHTTATQRRGQQTNNIVYIDFTVQNSNEKYYFHSKLLVLFFVDWIASVSAFVFFFSYLFLHFLTSLCKFQSSGFETQVKVAHVFWWCLLAAWVGS